MRVALAASALVVLLCMLALVGMARGATTLSLGTTDVTTTSVTLQWSRTGDFLFTAYHVEYTVAGADNWQLYQSITDASVTTVTVKGLTPGTAYQFRIIDVDLLGSQSSNVVSVTTRQDISAAFQSALPAIVAVALIAIIVVVLVVLLARRRRAPRPAAPSLAQPETPAVREAQQQPLQRKPSVQPPAAPQPQGSFVNPPAPSYQAPAVNPAIPGPTQGPSPMQGAGLQVPQNFCLKCGAPLPAGAAFCGACGAKIG